jgi:hypothetical protein
MYFCSWLAGGELGWMAIRFHIGSQNRVMTGSRFSSICKLTSVFGETYTKGMKTNRTEEVTSPCLIVYKRLPTGTIS